MLVTERTNERIEHNNRVFRDVNERIRTAAERYEHQRERILFLCECPVEDCVEEPLGRVAERMDGYVVIVKP
jgi:hypothetical protein